ncbi:pyrroline-5-carboxylate reductase [Leptospira sp. 2 VSF19]|uniref:Pyrroline-5-carboxylate reductase n=1 Tax=Leptospira soteropolitanensis TaxID=2950025 RepID=A0AAW5VM22_9LEPT|nr:pyrroline-5-carboxylate reductase [Leptospira soteropolitanensis]MCW7492922.1 pyrroline-5-carboxylate reductase [Leptospira soteropolitanensis]MCW7500157.1 pyrroline-5-carboxylate reductase [Leptospira soteropolitanensis]MCW7522408.1 pyrroline-5-carboxylate reductase [Leptospira soteropolitanensis]MCW7526264.1 pyrroline-5-carboxylate reductase [Leptospira soteropolitanensis]MCW7529624.1 pyrroline-5-carboxylate reductase [Leptospira soteropolitanensis]
MNPIETVGIVGLGKMGAAIATALVKKGTKVYGFDPNLKDSPVEGVVLVKTLEAVSKEAAVVVIAVKPNLVVPVLKEFSKPATFVSIAAGISFSQISQSAPQGSLAVRVMPNLPLVAERGAFAYFCEDNAVLSVEQLFYGMGTGIRVMKESLMDAVTGLSGSGPAYVLTFLQAMAEGGLQEGLSYEESLSLAMETIEGTLVYFRSLREEDKDLHPMEVKNWVTSPGGTTIYGLDALERGGFSTAVRDAVHRATERSKELGKG